MGSRVKILGTIRKWIAEALTIIKRDYKGYILISALYFAALILGVLYGLLNPQLQTFLHGTLAQAWEESIFSTVTQAYVTENWLSALFLTFLVNLILGSFVVLTVPSLPVFFAGPILAVYRAVLWGIIYSPTSPQFANAIIYALPVLLLEGEAYCIVCFPSFKAGLSWLLPKRAYKDENPTRKQAFRKALRELALVYILVSCILLVSAIVEVTVVSIATTYLK